MAKLSWGISACIIFLQAILYSKAQKIPPLISGQTINRLNVCFVSPEKGLEVQKVNLLEVMAAFEAVKSVTSSNYHCELCETKFIVNNQSKAIKDVFSKRSEVYVAGFKNYVRNVMASLDSNAAYVTLHNLKVRAQDYFTDVLEGIQETLYGAYNKQDSISNVTLLPDSFSVPLNISNMDNRSHSKTGVPIDYLTIDERDALIASNQVTREQVDAISHTKIVDFDGLRKRFNIRPLTSSTEEGTAERAFLDNTSVSLTGRCFELRDNIKEEVIKLSIYFNRDTLSVSTTLADKKFLRGKDIYMPLLTTHEVTMPERKVIIPEQKIVIPEQKIVIPEQKKHIVSKGGSGYVDVSKGGYNVQNVTSGSASSIDQSSLESIMDKLNTLFTTFYNPQTVVRSSATSNSTGSVIIEEAIVSSSKRQKQSSVELAVTGGISGITDQFQRTGSLQFPCVITVESVRPISCEDLLRRALQQRTPVYEKIETPIRVQNEVVDSPTRVYDKPTEEVEIETEQVSTEEKPTTTENITFDVDSSTEDSGEAYITPAQPEVEESTDDIGQLPNTFSYTDYNKKKG